MIMKKQRAFTRIYSRKTALDPFNTKLEFKADEAETPMGPNDYGERNSGRDLNLMLQDEIYAMNSRKHHSENGPAHNIVTWYNDRKNEIDLVFSNKKNIVQDVAVLNKFSVLSDHQLVRA